MIMKALALIGATACVGLFMFVDAACAQDWTQTSAPITNWSSVASSADGRKLVAVIKGGGIYTSQDSGTNWMPTSAPDTNWISIASSSDGSKLVAAVHDGGIYTSVDSGATWMAGDTPATGWSSVASSADGTKLTAVVGGSVFGFSFGGPPGPIYISSDSGATWTATSITNADCTSVASSADGTKLLAASWPNPIYSSTNSGATWTVTNSTFPYLVSIATSADGIKLIAGAFDPFHPPGSGGSCGAYVSTNSGATWTQTSAGDYGRGRAFVASSADGTRLVMAGGANAFGNASTIFFSTDSGDTWTANGAPKEAWSSVASSADGTKLVAVVDGGGIWTAQTTPAPFLSIAPSVTNVVLSWTVPSVNFTLQEKSDLSTTNWLDVTNTPTLNFTNLQDQVTVPAPAGNRFYRLKH
jgi:hypothetical protein